MYLGIEALIYDLPKPVVCHSLLLLECPFLDFTSLLEHLSITGTCQLVRNMRIHEDDSSQLSSRLSMCPRMAPTAKRME
jgi:hypothetical protein